MVVTLGLQGISSTYITLETSYVFILYVYYSRIKVSGFCQRRRGFAGTLNNSCLFGCKPKKGVGIQNYRFSSIAEHWTA